MDLAHLLHAELMPPLTARPAFLLAALFMAASSGGAVACGMEDPSSVTIQRGSLNIAFPQSLHVGTAIWQAQLAGKLPRDPLALRGDLTPEARAALRLTRATALLRQFAARIDTAAAPRAPLAIVLLGPVMWNRFESEGGQLRPALHVDGPRAGDVVVVTDLAVIEAVVTGSLTLADALRDGLVRLYGAPAEVASTQAWFAANPG
ncbi:MAG: hypothetical protein MUC86_01585 [Burkholderiaceae bacterium]|nr:hypothetical protein [Burkholderiaceae bacterium]